MNILVLNVGSSSIKYSVFSNEKLILKDDIQKVFTKKQRIEKIKKIEKQLKDKNIKIDAVGHRVVHGKDITKSGVLNSGLIAKIKKHSDLAPLHDPLEIEAIEAAKKHFKVKHVAVFDTSFHTTMPLKAKMYAIPSKFYNMGIKRYGFHGTSHKFVSNKLKGKTITCHLGNGCSITAINNGKSIDTSMGLTPLEGLVMGTRSGSIDPAVVFYLLEKGYSRKSIEELLNKESGILGISGISSDFLVLLKSKNKKAKLAIDIFVYSLVKYIGAYIAALNGIDNIVFTGGIGENNPNLIKKIMKNFNYLKKKPKVLVIRTNEELAIAKEVKKIIKS